MSALILIDDMHPEGEPDAEGVPAFAGKGRRTVPFLRERGFRLEWFQGSQVLLSTARLNKIRSVDRANLTMVVEAGCVLQGVQEEAAAHGLLFALSLAAEGSCTIGGNLATNAGGTGVLRYGNARELCLGLEVVVVPRHGPRG